MGEISPQKYRDEGSTQFPHSDSSHNNIPIATHQSQDLFGQVSFMGQNAKETGAKSGMLTARIYNHRALQIASRVVSQVANGCAAHDWRQVLIFQGKTCSLFTSFTTCVFSRFEARSHSIL